MKADDMKRLVKRLNQVCRSLDKLRSEIRNPSVELLSELVAHSTPLMIHRGQLMAMKFVLVESVASGVEILHAVPNEDPAPDLLHAVRYALNGIDAEFAGDGTDWKDVKGVLLAAEAKACRDSAAKGGPRS